MNTPGITPTTQVAADQPIAQPIDVTTTLTTTRYQELAAQFIASLDALTATIPKLELEQPAALSVVRGRLNIPDAFLGSSIATVEQTPEIQPLNTLDVAAGHDVLQFIEAFRPVLDKVAAVGRHIKFTMSSRKSLLAGDALRVYDLAKSVARDPRNAAIAAHVKNMKRDLNRPGRPKKAVPPDVRKAAKAAGAAASAAIIAAAAAESARAAATPTTDRDIKTSRDL
jgi:hypothetical protein